MDTNFDEFANVYKKAQLVEHANGLIGDGIINADEYGKQTCKVLFIAKEHNRLNDQYKSGNYKEWWNEHVYLTFSHRVSEWAHGIINDFPDYDQITYPNKEEALKSIAFINIKKTWGGSSSSFSTLLAYVVISKHLLQKQIKEIHPNIIITCFRHDYLTKQLFDFKTMLPTIYGFSYQKWDESLVINFYHPSARKSKALLYSQLKEVMNTATSN